MPYNGSGTFSIVNTFVANTTILSAAVNQNFTDIATGLSDVLTRDGQAGMTAVLKAVSGSVSAPGISFNSDATAGLYLSTTGIVGLVAKSLGILVNSSIYQVTAAAVQSGGSGYAVGDTITETGGTAITQAVLTVATLSGSAVATVTVTYGGFYTVKPADPVAQGSTSGIGSGATFNMTWSTQYTKSIVTDEAGALPWQLLGSSSFVSGLMAKANGLDFANGIGGANIAAALGATYLLKPQGILSPISSTTAPIPTSDQLSATRIYWTPYNGNLLPIFNGTSFVLYSSAQMFCDLTAGAQTANGIFDVYVFINAATPTLGFSPNWSAGTSGNITAGTCARGTSTGGTALSVLNGLYVNAVQQTVNNGATTYTMAINQGTYLGSIYVDNTAGQVSCTRSYGQNRKWGLWNAYNRLPIILQAGDSTASWAYTSGTIRASNNAPTSYASATFNYNTTAANGLVVFTGLAEEEAIISFQQRIGNTVAGAAQGYGIGLNSTTAQSGISGVFYAITSDSATDNSRPPVNYTLVPSLGINNFCSLENSVVSGTSTWQGTSVKMLLQARYNG